MSTQELLTFLFNAIPLGFIIIASMDFGTRLVTAYKQVSIAIDLPLTNTHSPSGQLRNSGKTTRIRSTARSLVTASTRQRRNSTLN